MGIYGRALVEVDALNKEQGFSESTIDDMVLSICKILDDYLPCDYHKVLERVELISQHYALSPISLTKNDFISSSFPGYLEHIRTNNIMMDKHDMKPFNSIAWGYVCRHMYDDDTNSELELVSNKCDAIFSLYSYGRSGDPSVNIDTIKLYISKGGIVNGDYYDLCYLKEVPYSYKKPISIPVSIICKNVDNYIIVDSREPKLKELLDNYNVRFGHNDVYFNIRKYKKL